jgi:hypothetical protein
MAGFPASLAVVRVALASGTAVSTLPRPAVRAIALAETLADQVVRNGFTAAMISFEVSDGIECWLRARDVQLIEVIPDEDPSDDRRRP